MFAKLTSFRMLQHTRPGLRPELVLLVAPAHANDNHASRHGRDGMAKRPVLTCQWVPSARGGLECRWYIMPDRVAPDEVTRPGEPGGDARTQMPIAFGGPPLALVAG
jgi:hypothetical protein